MGNGQGAPPRWSSSWSRRDQLRLAIDEILERRWGEKIEALGMYLDRGISWMN